MSLTIISKDNKDHVLKEKKHYIILEQKERMYLSAAGFFVSDKDLALGINREIVAVTALFKLNELRKQQKMKVQCTLLFC